MNGQFTMESFDSLSGDWSKLETESLITHIFSSLIWTKTWWQQFNHGNTLYLGSIKKEEKVIGIAPLMTKGSIASFIGGVNVCDYLDFIVKAKEELYFFDVLLDSLIKAGISRLELAPLRPDSSTLMYLTKIVQERGIESSLNKLDVSLDVALPPDWESYLSMLDTKQRHELKRKMRRLWEMGDISFRASLDANKDDTNMFLKLFQDSREDKAAFLTQEMESFFRSMFTAMARAKLLRLNILELNTKPIAATICLDYKDSIYLYNSGYDPEFRWVSAGLISKAMCIQESIERKKRRFDFLKGNEDYKYHLGGSEFPVFEYVITLG
jgi:CelD/BcsL family acetyltransferase involved in cellulose biosynthesis